MKYQKHYLSEEKDLKWCPLQSGIDCTSRCAWFDHEDQDCRMVLGIKDISLILRRRFLVDEFRREYKF